MHDAADTLIRLRNVSKLYRGGSVRTTALDDVTLDVREGEFVAVTGPSGCGKTTLLNVVGMVDAPTTGRYELAGVDVTAAREAELARLRAGNVGYVFQSFHLVDHLSVYQNVELPLVCLKVPAERRRARVRDVLELLELEHRASHYPSQLSGGQQQRVAIARAVVVDPKLIVADEPTGNLDTAAGDEVMDMLTTLHEQRATIVMVTHSSRCAERANRRLHMLDGRVLPDPA